VLKPGVRNGLDITLRVKLDAGVPVQDLTVANHQATIQRDGDRRATVALDPADSLPNKDFVLRYDVTGKNPEMAVLAHTGKHSLDAQRLGEGYFMLMIQPKEDERLTKSPPREIVFLVDVSGSMSGEPTAKVIGAMQNMLKLCRPIDTVQVITFASQSRKLFEKSLPVTEANIQRALNFTQGLRGGGGTEMLKGVKLAIDEPLDKERIRIVVMLTDGYIGNEAEIIEHVGKNCGDRIRFWAIGIGSSPNMFLIDGVAKQGGGMGKQLGLQDDTAALTQEVMTRIQRAQLAQIKLDWGPHQVVETFPAKLPELWAGRPVIVYGRYAGGTSGPITISGNVEGEPVSWPLEVALPAQEPAHDVLAKVWARQKIESLMQSTYYGGSPAVEEEVTALALDYRLMSQYTSFVAVDAKQAEQIQTSARPPRRMLVPVPLPEGTRWEGFYGEEARDVPALTFRAKSDESKALNLSINAPTKRESSLRLFSARGVIAAGQPMAPAAGALPATRFRLQQQSQAANRWFMEKGQGVSSFGRRLAASGPSPTRSGGTVRLRQRMIAGCLVGGESRPGTPRGLGRRRRRRRWRRLEPCGSPSRRRRPVRGSTGSLESGSSRAAARPMGSSPHGPVASLFPGIRGVGRPCRGRTAGRSGHERN
jgi:Ca-activated chloride channel homolog